MALMSHRILKVTVDLQGSNFAKIFVFFAYSKAEKGINNLVKKSIQNLLRIARYREKTFFEKS